MMIVGMTVVAMVTMTCPNKMTTVSMRRTRAGIRNCAVFRVVKHENFMSCFLDQNLGL